MMRYANTIPFYDSVEMEDKKNQVYMREATLFVDSEKISNNMQVIRKLTDKKIIAVIKDNGYGLGLYNMYHILKVQDIDFFAVSNSLEAKKLRQYGHKGEILLLAPELTIGTCIELIQYNVIFMLGSAIQADCLREASMLAGIEPRVHIKIDSGLGRYGFTMDHLHNISFYVAGMKVEGCYTHFASYGEHYKKTVQKQLKYFKKAVEMIHSYDIETPFLHASASKTLLRVGDLGFDAVRVGSLILGKCENAAANNFQDAVYLRASLFMKTFHYKGDYLGYGGEIKLKNDTMVGLIKAGHGDGVLIGSVENNKGSLKEIARGVKNVIFRGKARNSVYLDGKKVPILGQVGLDHMLVDLGDSVFEIGDEVRIKVNPLYVNGNIMRKVNYGEQY